MIGGVVGRNFCLMVNMTTIKAFDKDVFTNLFIGALAVLMWGVRISTPITSITPAGFCRRFAVLGQSQAGTKPISGLPTPSRYRPGAASGKRRRRCLHHHVLRWMPTARTSRTATTIPDPRSQPALTCSASCCQHDVRLAENDIKMAQSAADKMAPITRRRT